MFFKTSQNKKESWKIRDERKLKIEKRSFEKEFEMAKGSPGKLAIVKIAKPERKAEEPTEIDIIESLVSNYGMTGENLARQILLFMDFR